MRSLAALTVLGSVVRWSKAAASGNLLAIGTALDAAATLNIPGTELCQFCVRFGTGSIFVHASFSKLVLACRTLVP